MSGSPEWPLSPPPAERARGERPPLRRRLLWSPCDPAGHRMPWHGGCFSPTEERSNRERGPAGPPSPVTAPGSPSSTRRGPPGVGLSRRRPVSAKPQGRSSTLRSSLDATPCRKESKSVRPTVRGGGRPARPRRLTSAEVPSPGATPSGPWRLPHPSRATFRIRRSRSSFPPKPKRGDRRRFHIGSPPTGWPAQCW